MAKEQENLKILTSLGLTLREAKIYFILNKIGKASIKSLSMVAEMDRANIYPVITRLQELNLVKKILTTPTAFKAIPMYQGVLMLLENKEREFAVLSAKTKELLQASKQLEEETFPEKGCELVIIPKGKASQRTHEELFASAMKSNEAICSWPTIVPVLKEFMQTWKKMLKKNVRIRLIMYLPSGEALPSCVLALMENPNFKIRYIDSPPIIPLAIYDGRTAFLATAMTPSEALHLLVNSVNFVAFFQDYFELLWKTSPETRP